MPLRTNIGLDEPQVAIGLFTAFAANVGVTSLDLVADPEVMSGLLLGAALPFLFAGATLYTLSHVSRKITVAADT